MKRSIFLLCTALLALGTARSQQDGQDGQPWTLEACIRYAQQQNIAVQKQALQVEQNRVRLNTAQLSRLPDVGASLGSQMAFGRGRASNDTYIDANTLSGSASVSASVPVFQGLRIKRQIAGGKLDLQAAVADFERAREDVAVNVMSLYLQVLYNKELVAVAENQLALSTQQVGRSRALVANGKNPESALYESLALQARDELALTQARGDLSLALLDLSQALNRPSAQGFDVVDPELDSTAVDAMSHLRSPAEITAYALDNRPHIRAEKLRLASSSEAIRLARADRWPQITLSGGYGTNLYKNYVDSSSPLWSPTEGFWSQFRNNSSEYVGLSINIPIFNRMATRNNIRSADIGYRSQRLALTEAEQALSKQIEQAFYTARAAWDKYRSARKALDAARIAFAYEEQKAAAGRSTVFDFNDAKTRMEKAASELVQAKYEFILRTKILDFYGGTPLSL